MGAFAGLKRRKTNFDDLEKQFQTKKNSGDDRFYYPERDDQGNGFAIIRFLPTGAETPPFVKYFTHRFKGINGWFWHNCRTTFDEDCPCCELNRTVIEPHGSWDATPDRDKQIVRNRKRAMYFTSNILVVSDPTNPENEGKVFLFRYGSKIMDKIKGAIKPEFPTDDQFDPFNPWTGANFLLKIRKVKKQTNYDSSGWEAPSPMAATDKAIDAIGEKLISLDEFTSTDFCAPYDIQKAALNRALGISDREVNRADDKLPAEKEEKLPEEKPVSAPEQESTSDLASQDDLEKLFDDDVDF
jgi:hypothetical protein